MGNSLLDVNVFGRRAGTSASNYAKKAKPGKPSLDHLVAYEEEFKSIGLETDRRAPILIPDYRPDHLKDSKLEIHW
jgi:succinate dehydrogenase/fumarate reductase flavoprotein subunit